MLEFLLRVLIACACGSLIGYERSKRFKEAGIRTHVIVCCASALIMVVSKYGFADLGSTGYFFNGTSGADPARLASSVVSGIGFLGAGAIFRNKNTVKGLTTAAGLWATAGIGLTIGAGMYWLGVSVTMIIFFIQLLMHRIAVGADAFSDSVMEFDVENGTDFYPVLNNFVEELEGQVSGYSYSVGHSSTHYSVTLKTKVPLTPGHIDAFKKKNPQVISASMSRI